MTYLKFKATKIFNGYKFLKNKVLITTNSGVVVDIVDEENAGSDISVYDGILCPGFINCHCHLELSYLKNKILPNKGMVNFLLEVINNRNVEEDLIQEEIANAEQEMIKNGIVAVGDICNTTHTIQQKINSKIYYQNFIEIAGFVPSAANARFEEGKKIFHQFQEHFSQQTSLVPHAPYSVSSQLLNLIHQFNKNKLSSIHLQESQAEDEFFTSLKGDFTKLYKRLNIDISFFNKTYTSSLDYFLQQQIHNQSYILVHNSFALKHEIEKINQSNTQFFYCLCVLSNEYINRAFPLSILQNANYSKIVIGTDSLASNTCLNVLKELQTIKEKYTQIRIEQLLQFATINGAKALNIESKYGSFEKNKTPGILLINDFYNSAKPTVLM